MISLNEKAPKPAGSMSGNERRLIRKFSIYFIKEVELRIVKSKEYNPIQFILYGWFAPYEVFDAESGLLLATIRVITHHIDWTDHGMKRRPEEDVKKEQEDRDYDSKFYQKYPHLIANQFYLSSSNN